MEFLEILLLLCSVPAMVAAVPTEWKDWKDWKPPVSQPTGSAPCSTTTTAASYTALPTVSVSQPAMTPSRIGVVHVQNLCPFTVHSNVVHSPRDSDCEDCPPEERYSLLQPNSTASQPYNTDPDTGVSWKLWRTDTPVQHGPVQFEYTWDTTISRLYYDLSMVDAATVRTPQLVTADAGHVQHAFAQEGITVGTFRVDSKRSVVAVAEGRCEGVVCLAGERACRGAYNAWNDWAQQHDCSESVQVVVTLCGQENSTVGIERR